MFVPIKSSFIFSGRDSGFGESFIGINRKQGEKPQKLTFWVSLCGDDILTGCLTDPKEGGGMQGQSWSARCVDSRLCMGASRNFFSTHFLSCHGYRMELPNLGLLHRGFSLPHVHCVTDQK